MDTPAASDQFIPNRYERYKTFSGQVMGLHTSDLTADMVRAHVATTASGAVIVSDEIRGNADRFTEYRELKKLCDQTVEHWRNAAPQYAHQKHHHSEKYGYATSTVLRMITELKRYLVITSGLENNAAIAILCLDAADSKASKQRGIDRGNRTAKQRRPFYDAKGIIATAARLIDSNGYLKIIVGLVLLTGRRPSEIVLTGKLTQTSEYAAIFSGQLKTEKDKRITGKSGGNDRDEYIIPLLAKFDMVNNALIKLRNNTKLQEMIASMEKSSGAMTLPQVVNSRIASNCRNAARDAFIYRIPDFIDGYKQQPIRKMTTYTLRGVYAKINAMNAGLTDKTDTSYIREILGHSFEQSLSTSAAYDHCYYAGATLPKSTTVKKSGIDISELKIKGLDIGAVQNAGTGRNIDPVRLADLYQPKTETLISKAKRLFNKLAFWR